MKRHIDEQNGDNSEPEFCMSLAVETDHNVTGHIDEDRPGQIVYPSAWDSADLRLGIWHGRSARIEKVVDINSMPPGDSEFIEYSFLVRSSTAQVLAGPEHNISPWDDGHAELNGSDAFVALTGSQLRGTVLRTPVAWYYAGSKMVRVPVRVTFDVQGDGETVRATKHIPRSLIATALGAGSHLFTDATFTPDASPESNSVDGFVMRNVGSGETWANMRGGTGTYLEDNSSSTSCVNVQCDSNTNKFDQIRRAFYFFDTSSIGAGQQIDSSTFTAYHSSPRAYTSYELTMGICGSNSSGTTALANSDFESAQFTSFSSDGVAMSSLTYEVGYGFDFNTAGLDAVDSEGMTRICMGDKTYDFADSAPTWGAGHSAASGWYFSENSGSSFDPVLTVTHSESSAGGGAISSGSFGNSISLSSGL